MEGQPAIEQLRGKWVCEINELLALTKAKEQEAAKAYITRQVGFLPQTVGPQRVRLPRRCIMIGSNQPLQTRSQIRPGTEGTTLLRSIVMAMRSSAMSRRYGTTSCNAGQKAKVRMDRGEMPNYADQSLTEDYRAAQEAATQDDWRVGAIQGLPRQEDSPERRCASGKSRTAPCP